MPTTRKRVSRKKGSVASTDLSQWDIEFLLCGWNLLCGLGTSLRTLHDQRQGYRKHKKYLLSLMGRADDFGYVALPYGSRFWSWYRFEHKDDMTDHYRAFREEWSKGNRLSEFQWLEAGDFLLPGEQENFIRQEKRYAEQKESLKQTLKEKKIIDFPANTK